MAYRSRSRSRSRRGGKTRRLGSYLISRGGIRL